MIDRASARGCKGCDGSGVHTPNSGMTRPCPRCQRQCYAGATDPMTRPHVDVSIPIVGGSVRLRSASGPLEAVWIDLRDQDLARVAYDKATYKYVAAAVRLTPSQAEILANVLCAEPQGDRTMKQVNAYQFHMPTDAQKAAMQRLRDAFQSIDSLIREQTPACCQQSIALTALEEAAMWANKAANQRDD